MFTIDENQRPVTTFLGVKIYRMKEETPNLKELKNGTIRELKPFCTYAYGWQDAYPYSTQAECKKALKECYQKFIKLKIGTPELFIKIFNQKEK